MKHIVKHAFSHAVLTALYVALIASFLYYVPHHFPKEPDTVLVPIIMLSLFVFSAAVTGTLVFGKPILWYLDERKKEAVMLLILTLLFFFLFLLLMSFIFITSFI